MARRNGNGRLSSLKDHSDDDEDIVPRRSRNAVSYNEEEPNGFESDEEDIKTKKKTQYKFTMDDDDDEAEEAVVDDIPEVKSGSDKDDDDIDDLSESSEEVDPAADKEDDYVDDEDDDEDAMPSRRKRRRNGGSSSRNRRSQSKIGSDESDFKADSEDDEDSEVYDDFVDKLQEKRFVATDEEEGSDSYSYSSHRPNKRAKRSKSRSRSRSVEPGKRGGRTTRASQRAEERANEIEDEDDEEEEDSIQKEIQELYDSSPESTPVKHKLRERGTKIDYTIPPPLNPDNQNEFASYNNTAAIGATNSTYKPRGRGRAPASKSDYRKILFPTAGPFGGSDVISLFGKNIPPGGIPIEGMTNDSSLTAIGQNASDSDSSDEEIVPVNGTATLKNGSSGSGNTINHTKLITSGTSADPKSKKKNNLSDTDPLGVDMNIDFSVIGGLENYINQLKEMVALPLLYPELYQNFGLTPPRGVLFHGPPGTGKTLMARALAASCSTAERKITFFMRKGADCLSKWVGEAERQLRLLFEEAKNQQPSIIFFDEIDGLAPVRSSKQEQIHASIVSTLLALMDGMDNRGQVIVIGATNRPDSIDPALRRPGRFDREFYFPLPDQNARSEILQIHTRKWQPPLPEGFVDKVAGLTKGYGGADLRALCTEAALNSIQRKYPQIYQTNDKLKVNPSKVKVIARDFMKAIDKIVPSSARSTSSGSSPLSDHLKPLLEDSFKEVVHKLDELLPNTISTSTKKKLSTLEEALYFDPTVRDSDGGFAKQELLKNLENARICKPHLLICGDQGNGQQYISAAILNHLEGFQVQSLDMGNTFGDASRTPESSIVQAFIEARRHQPAVIFIPNIDIWFQVVPHSAKATLTGLLRSLNSSEKILLLGVAETTMEHLDDDIRLIFGFNNNANNVTLHDPSREKRAKYFEALHKTLLMKPWEFINDLTNRPKRKLKQLKIVPAINSVPDEIAEKKKQKEIEYQDTKLKNILKLKLAGLMDLFKNRYKRFRKPVIDESLLYHLFEPAVLDNPLNNYEVLYEKSDDPKHENMIREISTGRYYYNMDLDIIEERLWNGYYSEPKQFLKDIRMVVKDSITIGDRERILKANEMLTNAQFGIDDFSTPEFLNSCKELRAREILRQEKIVEEHKKAEEEFKKKQAMNIENLLTNESLDSQPIDVDATPIESNGHTNGDVKMKEPGEESVEVLKEEFSKKEEEEEVSKETTNEDSSVEAVASKQTTNEESSTEVVPLKEVPIAAAEVESESESEIETEPEREDKELVVDGRINEFFTTLLPELTDNYGVEKLEIVMAKFMDIVWNDRANWDKRETISKLIDAAKEFMLTLN
ncbi:ATPase histone chaperone Yta7p [[Candida] anglica]|uniref:ATPase histone chaperone Yta7p n=1 Tax=[Candida] anglica TaxID=148631 RepID=A0ABP0ENB3_9ASCO